MVIDIADLKASEEGTEQEFQDILQVFQKSGIAEEINQNESSSKKQDKRKPAIRT